jgi:hypothetical protein
MIKFKEAASKEIEALREKLGLDGLLILGIKRSMGANFFYNCGLNGPEETGIVEQHRAYLQARCVTNMNRPMSPSQDPGEKEKN